MSSQSSTSSLESLKESSTTKCGLLSHTCTNQIFRTKIIFVTTQHCIGNTNWCICGNCSKIETFVVKC